MPGSYTRKVLYVLIASVWTNLGLFTEAFRHQPCPTTILTPYSSAYLQYAKSLDE